MTPKVISVSAVVAVLLTVALFVTQVAAAPNEATCSNRVLVCNTSSQYFPTKIAFEHATSVTALEYYGTYVIVRMSWNAWSGAHQQTLVLVRCGCPAPADVGGLGVNVRLFFVPVSTVFIEETVAVPKLYLIGQRDKVNSIASVTFVTTPELREDVANGIVQDIANNFTRLSLLATGLPDVLLTGSGSTSRKTGWTGAMTERQILDSDAGETSPLGRAELVKLTGVLTGSEDSANTIFSMVKARYAEAKRIATSETRQRPSVLLGVPFSGFGWSLTRGTSYMGQFMRDAHTDYRNARDELNAAIGSLNATTAVRYFAQADYWVNAYYVQPNGARFTMDQLAAGNQTSSPGGDRSVFSQLQAFQCGRVLSNAKAVIPGLPGNPFFELGVLRPDLILLDLVYHLHPYVRTSSAFFSAYQPTFYEVLAPLTDRTGVPPCPAPMLPVQPPQGRAFLQVAWEVEGADVFAVRDILYPTLKDMLAASLSIAKSDFDITVGGGSFNGSASSGLTLGITAQTVTCAGCPSDAGVCNVELARQLVSFGPGLQAALRSVSPGLGQALVGARTNAATPVTSQLMCSTGATVPTRDIPGFTASDTSGTRLSKSTIIGIAVGSVAGFLVLAGLIGFAAFRTGHRRGYNSLLSQQQQINTIAEMKPKTDPTTIA